MKKLILIIIMLSASSSFAKEEVYSLGWLKKGLITLSNFKEGREVGSIKSAERAHTVGVWLQGFYSGLGAFHLPDHLVKYKDVPKEWKNSVHAAQKILDYIEYYENKYSTTIPLNGKAAEFIALWYRSNHPKLAKNNKMKMAIYADEILFLKFYIGEKSYKSYMDSKNEKVIEDSESGFIPRGALETEKP